jgi:hypothetical protein
MKKGIDSEVLKACTDAYWGNDQSNESLQSQNRMKAALETYLKLTERNSHG